MNTDKIYAEQIANEYAPKDTSKIVALRKLDAKAKTSAAAASERKEADAKKGTLSGKPSVPCFVYLFFPPNRLPSTSDTRSSPRFCISVESMLPPSRMSSAIFLRVASALR